MSGGRYSAEIPEYGDVMTVEEFKQACESSLFVDYDGSGWPARNGKMQRGAADDRIKPSRLVDIPTDATHIVWFNK